MKYEYYLFESVKISNALGIPCLFDLDDFKVCIFLIYLTDKLSCLYIKINFFKIFSNLIKF